MSDDIVERLRSITWIGSDALCRDAANEIEELRKERDSLRESRDHIGASWHSVRKERDEARRLASEYACITEIGVRAFARNRGWDCFKEDNHNA